MKEKNDMPHLGDIVTYMTDQGQPRVAFVSAEPIDLPVEAPPSTALEVPGSVVVEQEEEPIQAQVALLPAPSPEEAVLSDEAKAAQEAHAQAELVAGGPIQRVEIVNVAALQPPPVPAVIEEPPAEPTGPALTLHVLLHSSDADYAILGPFGIYADVPHSDACLPGTWH
jgi:hypothetical protein